MRTLNCTKCAREVQDDVTENDVSKSPNPEYNISSDDVPTLCKMCNQVAAIATSKEFIKGI